MFGWRRRRKARAVSSDDGIVILAEVLEALAWIAILSDD